MPKILLVEDIPELREMLMRRLLKREFAVVTAGNGEEACAVARSELPDLILMDISMPVMDGLEASKLLKAETATQAIPIIALTGFAMASDRDKALQAGCDDFETKPIDLKSLLEKMQRLLQGRVCP